MQVNVLEIYHGYFMEPYTNMPANFMQSKKALLLQTLSAEIIKKREREKKKERERGVEKKWLCFVEW